MAKVSIIVPIYNVEKYIHQCINSLINQTISDIEIILIDDGSPDKCPQICDEYEKMDTRIKVVHKENGGLGYARNTGIEVATGDYIAFCDSDDYVDIRMYDILHNYMKENNLDVCYCNYVLDQGVKLNYKTGSPKDAFVFCGKEKTKEFVLEMIGPSPDYPSDVKYMVSSCMAMYSTKIIKDFDVKFMCERNVLSEDTLFNLDFLSHASNVGYIPQQFYYYRYNPSSLSRTFNHKKAEIFITFLDEVYKRLSFSFSEQEYRQHYQRFVFYIFRLLIKYEAISNVNNKRKEKIKDYCNHPLLKEVYNEYPFEKLPILKRLLFISMRNRWVNILIYISMIENKIKKQI